MESIPASMRSSIKTADLDDRIELASMLEPEEEAALGLGAAVKLTHAPARPESRFYWRWCARAIVKGDQLPFPPEPPKDLASSDDLGRAEQAVACADLYLWLARTPEFRHLAHATKRSAALATRSQSRLIRLCSLGWILAGDAPPVDVSFPFTIVIGSVRTAIWSAGMTPGMMI